MDVIVKGVRMSVEAARCAEWACVDPSVDVLRVREGLSRDELLEGCLDGVEDASVAEAWAEYVDAVMASASQEAR